MGTDKLVVMNGHCILINYLVSGPERQNHKDNVSLIVILPEEG